MVCFFVWYTFLMGLIKDAVPSARWSKEYYKSTNPFLRIGFIF